MRLNPSPCTRIHNQTKPQQSFPAVYAGGLSCYTGVAYVLASKVAAGRSRFHRLYTPPLPPPSRSDRDDRVDSPNPYSSEPAGSLRHHNLQLSSLGCMPSVGRCMCPPGGDLDVLVLEHQGHVHRVPRSHRPIGALVVHAETEGLIRVGEVQGVPRRRDPAHACTSESAERGWLTRPQPVRF